MDAISISVQEADFTADEELEALQRLTTDPARTGALATFTGLVRDLNQGDEVRAIFLEHYPGMTEKALRGIAQEAAGRWSLLGIRIVHRIGRLQPSERIVMVSVASMHRKDALRACDFLMDCLKTRAPFWKKESTRDGSRWVAARSSDEAAARAWSEPEGS